MVAAVDTSVAVAKEKTFIQNKKVNLRVHFFLWGFRRFHFVVNLFGSLHFLLILREFHFFVSPSMYLQRIPMPLWFSPPCGMMRSA